MRTNNEQAFLRELAILIKKERIAKGKSRDALAEVVNLSTRGIEEFETKYTNIGIVHLLNIVAALHIDLSKVKALHKEYMQEEMEERINNLGKYWND